MISDSKAGAAFGFAVVAAVAIKLPTLFGVPFDDGHAAFYAVNAPLLVLATLTAYLCWRQAWGDRRTLWGVAGGFAAAAAVVNGYPLDQDGQVLPLVALHLPIALWLVVGVAFAGGRWGTADARMDFIRYSGETFIHYVLIALGGGVFTALMALMFHAIGVDVERFVNAWLLPCGAAGAVIVASWLVVSKHGVGSLLAPMLTRLFAPLFAVMLVAFLAVLVGTGRSLDLERDLLIALDLLLAVVVGLVLYAISARADARRPDLFDGVQLVLVASALVVDIIALAAIAARIDEFGFTPNRTAALGMNLVLLVNLAWTAVLYARFVAGRAPFAALERWQTAYLPVYAAWAAVVVIAFPPVFGF